MRNQRASDRRTDWIGGGCGIIHCDCGTDMVNNNTVKCTRRQSVLSIVHFLMLISSRRFQFSQAIKATT